MVSYIIRRVLQAILIIILVSIAIFLLVRQLPGDPIEMLVSQNTITELTPETYEQMRHEKGLDKPLVVQYVNWAAGVLKGDLGRSVLHNYDIAKELKDRIIVTLSLGLTAFIIAIILGPLFGIICAVRRGKFIDNLVTVLANVGITAPAFWIGILLIYFIGLKANLLPIYGYTLPWKDFVLSVRQSIMPVFVIALGPVAAISRQVRSSVIEVLGEDYVRTAWSKGLKERTIVFRHVLKNSLMPVVTLLGTQLRLIVGGSVVVETVFVIPGMGKMIVDGMLSNDYPVVQAVTLVMTIVVVVSSLVVDLLYCWIDPRIQYS